MMLCGKTGTLFLIDMEMKLDKERMVRYSRAVMLPEIGEKGQKKLLCGSVLIVGAGALGGVCAMYLAASGVGRIGIIDFDTVGISNLQRQLSYTESDVGVSKVKALSARMTAINSDIIVETRNEMLGRRNAADLFAKYDVIVEGSDNPSTKYLVTDAARSSGKPCVVGGVRGFVGQVAIFPASCSTLYRDLFPDAPCEGGYTPCAIGGVLGPLPGVVASIQAAEAIKLLAGINTASTGSFFQIDLRSLHTTRLELA